MTPRFLANTNKIRILTAFLYTVLLVLAIQLLQSCTLTGISKTLSSTPSLNDTYFVGLRHATAKEVKAALPEGTGKSALLEFSSRMCHDCQRLKPVVHKLISGSPSIFFKNVDVLEDRDKAAALLSAFKPVTVPVLIFIDANGEIKNVLYNYQSEETVKAALIQLQPKPATAVKTQAVKRS